MSRLLELLDEAEMWAEENSNSYDAQIRKLQENLDETQWIPVFELALGSIRGIKESIIQQVQVATNLPVHVINRIYKANFDLGGCHRYYHSFLCELGKPPSFESEDYRLGELLHPDNRTFEVNE